MALGQLKISEADKAAEDNSKPGRVKKWLARIKLEDEYADEEGAVPTYCAGLYYTISLDLRARFHFV